MKAITTRYIGATDRRPARILATDLDGNRVWIPADSCGDGQFPYDAAHRAAAEALCRSMRWPGAETLIGGSVKGGQVWVFPPTPVPVGVLAAADDCGAVLDYGGNTTRCKRIAGHPDAHTDGPRMWTAGDTPVRAAEPIAHRPGQAPWTSPARCQLCGEAWPCAAAPTASEPHTIGTEAPTAENDPIGRFRRGGGEP